MRWEVLSTRPPLSSPALSISWWGGAELDPVSPRHAEGPQHTAWAPAWSCLGLGQLPPASSVASMVTFSH